MYRVFYESKELGRFCVHTYHENYPLEVIIQQIKYEFTNPKNHNTSCQILDDNDKVLWTYKPTARSEAQKQADRRYNVKHKGERVNFNTTFKKAEFDDIMAILDKHKMGKVEFIRWAVKKLEVSNENI